MSRKKPVLSTLLQQLDQNMPPTLKKSPYYRPIIIILMIVSSAFGLHHYQQSAPTTTGGLEKGAQVSCYVQKIYDGDTITAICHQQTLRIRLVGIDAPEMKQAPYGENAKSALQKKLPKQFELHSAGTDRYQRTLGTLYANGENLNLWLVREGFAVAYADKSTAQIYRDAEAEAKAKRLGIWREKGLHQDPKAWRKHHNAP